jgi:hypothetical protein
VGGRCWAEAARVNYGQETGVVRKVEGWDRVSDVAGAAKMPQKHQRMTKAPMKMRPLAWAVVAWELGLYEKRPTFVGKIRGLRPSRTQEFLGDARRFRLEGS